MGKSEDDAIRTIDLSVLKSIGNKNKIGKTSKTSILRSWREGRISGLDAIKKLGGWKKGGAVRKAKGGAVRKAKGGAVKKYSHGGAVHTGTGHALTYKR